MAEEDSVGQLPLFSLPSLRLKIGLMLMLGLTVIVCMRTDLNMAVVCMVNTTSYRSHLGELENEEDREATRRMCSRSEEENIVEGYTGSLEWTPQMQASLLTASFYSSLATIPFSGSIADRFGPKLMLAGACLIYVIVSIASPLLSGFSFNALFGARLIMGLAEGFVMPSIASMAGRWFPPGERATMTGIYTTGNHIGSSFSSVISAALCASSFGWHSIFYFFGALGILWIVGWLILASNSPITNTFISDAEAKFIYGEVKRKEKSKSIPWRSMLRSKPIYACLCVQFAYNFSSVLMQTFLPTYFRDELMIPLAMNGAYTMIPFVVQIFAGTLSSVAADALKRKSIFDATTCVKFFQTVCASGMALSLLALAFLPSCDQPWIAAIVLAFYGIAYSFGIPGYFTALLSIAPQFSGTLTSMTMISATLANICSPMMASLLMTLASSVFCNPINIEIQRTPHIWKVLFVFTAVLNVIGAVIFFIYGDGEVQEWARTEKKGTSSVDDAEDHVRSRIEEQDVGTI